MVSLKFRRFGKSTALVLSIASLMGCPQVTSSRTLEASLDSSLTSASEPRSEELAGQEVSAVVPVTDTTDLDLQETATSDMAQGETVVVLSQGGSPVEPAVEGPVTYAVCSDIQSWQRPTAQEQQKQLSADPRYAGALEEEPLKAMSQNFWQHEALSFTTYALSARMEPMNFTGLWPIGDQLWDDCYTGDAGERIMNGELAEAWLMNHRVTDVQWQDGQYQITVQPASSGVQVVQFERLESESELPLMVVRANGQPVEVVSGDW